MTIALVIAGGNGKRTGLPVPKQFLTVYEKPIIVYTMENLQRMSEIERIVVVLPSGWESFVDSYCIHFGIAKYCGHTLGGDSRIKSVANGLEYLTQIVPDDEMIVLVDANRPLMPHGIIHNAIEAARRSGASVSVESSMDSLYQCNFDGDNGVVECSLDRKIIFKGQNPECACLKDFHSLYKKAIQDRLPDMAATALFLHYGQPVSTVRGSSMNFKITTVDDLELFRAFVAMKRRDD